MLLEPDVRVFTHQLCIAAFLLSLLLEPLARVSSLLMFFELPLNSSLVVTPRRLQRQVQSITLSTSITSWKPKAQVKFGVKNVAIHEQRNSPITFRLMTDQPEKWRTAEEAALTQRVRTRNSPITADHCCDSVRAERTQFFPTTKRALSSGKMRLIYVFDVNSRRTLFFYRCYFRQIFRKLRNQQHNRPSVRAWNADKTVFFEPSESWRFFRALYYIHPCHIHHSVKTEWQISEIASVQARSHWVLAHVNLYVVSIWSLRFYGNGLLNDRCNCNLRSVIMNLIVLRSLRSLNFGNHWSQRSQRSLCCNRYNRWYHMETRLRCIMSLGVVLTLP